MNQDVYEKLWDKVMDSLGQLFIEKCIDSIYNEIDKYKKEDEIFISFFESLDESQKDNFKKVVFEELVYGYNCGILDINDYHTEYSIQYFDSDTKKELSINGDFSDALIGEFVSQEYGWINRFSKKIKIR